MQKETDKNIIDILLSILSIGSSSPLLNHFFKICTKLSIANIRVSKFRNELLRKTGLNEEDLAIDIIADLFRQVDGKFVSINKFFNDILKENQDVSNDEVFARLGYLIRSSGNQMISRIRKEYLGEIYFNIKMAIDRCIERNSEIFRKKTHGNVLYIYSEDKIDFNLKQIPEDELVYELTGKTFKTRSIPELMREVFSILNSQYNYCNAIELSLLTNVLVSYYKKNYDDYLKHQEKVYY